MQNLEEAKKKKFNRKTVLFWLNLIDYELKSDDELLCRIKKMISNREEPLRDVLFLTSHQNFYTSYDGRNWYCGFLKIHSTYDDAIKDELLGKGDNELEAVIDALTELKNKQGEKL